MSFGFDLLKLYVLHLSRPGQPASVEHMSSVAVLLRNGQFFVGRLFCVNTALRLLPSTVLPLSYKSLHLCYFL